MLALGGFAFLMACVFGTYAVDGGSMPALLEALPFEMLTIGGAAIGTFFMANSMHDVKHTLGGMTKVLKGSAYKRDDYVDLLSLLFLLVRLASTKGRDGGRAAYREPRRTARRSSASRRS